MANKRILIAARGPQSGRSIFRKMKRGKTDLPSQVKFIGPSILRSDEGFILIASGNGEVTYGTPNFLK